jgi:hypothetical protein
VSKTLQLEYACTSTEMAQAQALNLRTRLGRGSKWRTRLILALVLAGMLVGAWFRFREMPELYRALMIAAIVAGSCLFAICKSKFRKSARRPVKLEISERDFAILGPDAKVTMPWSAFSECLESSDLFVLLDRAKTTLIVVPKRAFPSESWQTWFRAQATQEASHTAPAWHESPALAPSTSADRITFTFQLGFRDYLDRTLASWRTWGSCLIVGGLLLGASLYSAAHPPPHAVYSDTEMFFMFVLPFYLVCVMIGVLTFSIHGWRSHAKYNRAQQVALSEASMDFAGIDGSGTVPWTSFKQYKETLWSFILWRGSRWVLFPKRAFGSWDDLSRCRELLDRHLQRSRWFLG